MIYCFIQHALCFIFLLACFWFISICFHDCSCASCLFFMLYALCHALDAQIFSFPCTDVQVYMLTCLILCLRLCLASTYMFVCMFYAPMPMSMLVTCLYAWVCVLPCLYVYIYMLTCAFPCLYVQIGVFTCLDQSYLHAFMPLSRCLRASRHIYVLRPRPCLSCHVLLQPFCSFYRIFLCFSLLVQTRSRSYVFCHHPYTKTHIKGFGSPLFACLCLLAFMLYALCQPLQLQVLPCLAPSVGLILFGYIQHL